MNSPRERALRKLPALLVLPSLFGLALTAQEPPSTTPAQKPTTQQPATQPDPSKGAFQSLEAVNRAHTEFRRLFVAELQSTASQRSEKIVPQSLLITSCNDRAMLAGVSFDGAGAPRASGAAGEDGARAPKTQEKPKEKDPEGAPREAKAELDRDRVGMIAIVGSTLTIRSRPIEGASTGASTGTKQPDVRASEPMGSTVTLQPGYYIVRRNPRVNGLDLVDFHERIVATIPGRKGLESRPAGGTAGDPRTDGDNLADKPDQRPTEASARIGGNGDWARIYMDILHAVDLDTAR